MTSRSAPAGRRLPTVGAASCLLAAAPAAAAPAAADTHAEHQLAFGDHRPAWRDALRPAAPVPSPPAAGRAVVYGYHPYWGVDPTSLDFERLTHLAIFGVELQTDGTLTGTSHWTDVAPAVVPLAHAAGVRVHLTLISFDDDQHAAVLPSATRRAAAIAALVDLVVAHGGDGVNLDIEGMSSAYKDDLVSFTTELKAALPAGQDDVYLATPAVDWYGAFDYDRLCEASDGLFIMGYGYHWSGSNPGPVAPLFGGDPWSDYALDWSVADYLASGAWSECIVLGLPTYGRDWPSSSPSTVPGTASATGSSVVMSSAVDIAQDEGRRWEATTHTPYVIRSDSQLWYDDTESLGDKIAWAVDQDLQGVGFWALGYEGEDPAFWQMVEEESATQGGPTDSGDTGSGGDDLNGGGGGGEHEPPGSRYELEEGGCSTSPAAGGLALALLGLVGRRRHRR